LTFLLYGHAFQKAKPNHNSAAPNKSEQSGMRFDVHISMVISRAEVSKRMLPSKSRGLEYRAQKNFISLKKGQKTNFLLYMIKARTDMSAPPPSPESALTLNRCAKYIAYPMKMRDEIDVV
jgi:hypothetical protein